MKSLPSKLSSTQDQSADIKPDATQAVGQLLTFITNLHAKAESDAAKLTFKKKDPNQACLVSLYLSLLELAGAFILLVKSKSHVLVPSTIRSLLETYVEFENLRKDDAYMNDMEFYHLGQEIKVLEAAKAGESVFLADIAKMSNLDEIIKQHKDRRNHLRKQNARALQIKARFEKAGFAEWYVGLYGFLSGNTHACISSIFYRHFARDGDGVSIVYGRILPAGRMLPHMDLTASLLLDASKTIHSFYGGEDPEEFANFNVQLAEIRKQYSED